MSEGGTHYVLNGQEVVVARDDGVWRVSSRGRSVEDRYLDVALQRLLGGPTTVAAELAAAVLAHPEGGTIG